MKTYKVTIQTSNGKVSYEYESEINETVNVMWNNVFQCVARNGKEINEHYAGINCREVQGR